MKWHLTATNGTVGSDDDNNDLSFFSLHKKWIDVVSKKKNLINTPKCHLIPIQNVCSIKRSISFHFLCSLKYLQHSVWRYALKLFGVATVWRLQQATQRQRSFAFKWQTSSYVLIKCTHTDRPASIMDLPSSLACNEWDLKQRRMLPASQTLNTQMAQIADAAPETGEAEVVPEKLKITLNKTRQEGKQKNNM